MFLYILFLTKYNLSLSSQSGFRQNHSCETALVKRIDSWLSALDESKMVASIMVDMRTHLI